MSEPLPIEIGDKLGQFKLVELIAIGGMGIVYRGYDTALDRYVAVKVLSPELTEDPAVARRFLDEARASAALNHVNVVHIYSAGEQAGLYYFVMELVNGQHMETLIDSAAPLPVWDAVEYIRQAALGLQHAHEHGIIHGDVKPANFLISEAGIVKVTDFGLARRVKSAAATSDGESLFGTPGYVSPEVIRGSAPDHRSDIYSLGATLFHALAGRAPFLGATPEETLRRQTHEPAPAIQKFNDQVPAPVGHILHQMLVTDPAGRYQSYKELLQAFTRLGSEPKSVGTGRTSPPRLAKAPRETAPAAPPPPTPASPVKKETWFTVTFTLIAFFASLLILYLVYKNKLTQTGGPPPATNINIAVDPPSVDPSPVDPPPVDPQAVTAQVEAEAQAKFTALNALADAELAAGNFGRANAVYKDWPATQFAKTAAHQLVAGELLRIAAAARRVWVDHQPQLTALRAEHKYPEARAIVDRLAAQCDGLPAVLKEMKETRRRLVEAERQQAGAKETAARERFDQLHGQVDGFITTFQWEKAQQEIERALTEAGPAGATAADLAELQAELTSLVTLRNGVAARLKDKPSAVIGLATKRGEQQAQVTVVDAGGVTLRQTFGDAGFAETRLTWTELTPASACRVLMLNLEQNNADELFGYAVLIVHQALAKQARIDDARKTLQIVAQRQPARAPIIDRYLTRLAELEAKLAALIPPAPTPAPEPPAPAVVRAYEPLDISAGCNATFLRKPRFGEDDALFGNRSWLNGLPKDGRIVLPEPSVGVFQLRIADRPDSIGLTRTTGRLPNSATIRLPRPQRRRYERLAILSASSSGSATIKLHFRYDNGTVAEAKIRAVDWTLRDLPDGAQSVIELPVPDSDAVRHLFLDEINVDPDSRLTEITLTWIQGTTEVSHHCVGIFAISGLPVDAAP